MPAKKNTKLKAKTKKEKSVDTNKAKPSSLKSRKTRSQKAGLTFNVSRIRERMKHERMGRISPVAAVFLTATIVCIYIGYKL